MMKETSPIIESEAEKTEYEYEHFDNKRQRDAIFFFTKNAVEYIEKSGECNLVFIDRAARPAYAAIDEYWNTKHHDDGLTKPGFYFVNPRGFVIDEWAFTDKDKIDNNVIVEIEKNFGHLMKDKDKPLLVVDTCIHSGSAVSRVDAYFKHLGFKDVRFLIANSMQQGNFCKIKSEIPSIDFNVCDVFGDTHDYGDLVLNNEGSVVSKRNKKPGIENKIMLIEAGVVRREMRQIVREGLGV